MSITGAFKSLPAAATGLAPVSGASAWGYGSWLEIISATSSDIIVYGLTFQIEASPVAQDTTYEQLFEIATGNSGSEIVIAQLPYSYRADTYTTSGSGLSYWATGTMDVYFIEPITISAGTRLSVRVADSLTSSITYGATKLLYQENTATNFIYIDFGSSSPVSSPDSQGRYWNSTNGSITGLKNKDNTVTPFSLTQVVAWVGENVSGTTSSTIFPSTATGDSLYSTTATTPEFNISGLDSTKQYKLTFYASRTGAGSNRTSRYTCVGANTNYTELNATDNIDNVATITNIVPDSSGIINVKVTAGTGNDSGYLYLGVMVIEYIPATVTPSTLNFGYETIGSNSGILFADGGCVNLISVTQTIYLTGISVYCSGSPTKIKGLIFSNNGSGGSPGTLLFVGNEASVGASLGFTTSTLSGTLNAGTYWIGHVANGSGTIKYNTGVSGISECDINISYSTPTNNPSYTLGSGVAYTAYLTGTTSNGTTVFIPIIWCF